MQQGAGRRVFLRAPSAPPSHRHGAGRRCAHIGAAAWVGRCRNRISRRWGSPAGWGGRGLSVAARTLVMEARACNLMCPAATRPKSMHAAFESARTSEIEQNRESRFALWPPRQGVLCGGSTRSACGKFAPILYSRSSFYGRCKQAELLQSGHLSTGRRPSALFAGCEARCFRASEAATRAQRWSAAVGWVFVCWKPKP